MTKPSWRWLVGLVFIAVVLRLGVVIASSERLQEDVDGYIAIAANLQTSGTFGTHANQPTAFRPPLYPLVVSGWSATGRGLLNVVCGSLVVALTWFLTPGATRSRWLAAFFTAVSPLGVYYAGYSMTEIVCGLLLWIGLIHVVVLSTTSRHSAVAAVLLGLSLGLASLTRPTCYAVAAAWLAWLVVARRWCDRSVSWGRVVREPLIAGGVLLVTVSPWVIRNVVVFDRPILTTTHGGYTMLLGNNNAFYDDIVNAPWGTVWTDGQQRWVSDLNAAMDEAGVDGELARDAYQKRLAWDTIRRRPSDFARACWLRFRRFWNLAPQSGGNSPVIIWGVSLFYGVVWTLAVVGVSVGLWRWPRLAVPTLLLPAVFCAVHLIYWSNARMRLPVEPAGFLFAAVGLNWLWERAVAVKTPSPPSGQGSDRS